MPTLTVKPSSRRAAADGVRRRQRRAEQRLGPGHIQKRFVNAVLLNIGRIVAQI